MRHAGRFFASLVVGLAMFAGGEVLAFASPSIGSVPLGNTSCQPAKTQAAMAQGRLPMLTLGEAQACWPNAKVAGSGMMTQPGEYLIPHGAGWVHAGYTVTVSVNGHALSSRDVLAWSCGDWVNVTVDSWEQYLTYIDWHTGNTTYVCNYSYNNWKTPTCSGAGTCQSPQTGVLGNYTGNENPWYDQVVYYGPFSTDTFHCRHYIYSDATYSYWCN